jgi:hypothetical protein
MKAKGRSMLGVMVILLDAAHHSCKERIAHMWELLESFVYYCKHKKKRLPLFVVLILMAITLFIYMYPPPQSPPPPSIEIPVMEVTPLPSPSPTIQPLAPVKRPKAIQAEIPEYDPYKEDPPVVKAPLRGNAAYFGEYLSNKLRAEGYEISLGFQIFQNMIKQFDQPEDNHYDLIDGVRDAMPDASPEEIEHVTELVSRAAKESLHEHKLRSNE